jgi:hypothetical protein
VRIGGVDVSIGGRVFVGTFIAAAVILPPALAVGTYYCENVNFQWVIVGEARQRTLDGADQCYANVYWDQGDELSLGGSPGGASTAATNLGFHATTHTNDNSITDCSDVTYTLTYRRSNTTSSYPCPSAFESSTDTLIATSCGNNQDLLIVDKTFGGDGFPYREYWQWELEIDANDCSTADSGCGRVYPSTSCTVKDF